MKNSSKVVWTGRVLSTLIFIPFTFSAVSKLFWESMFPQMPTEMERMGLPMDILKPIACIEALCVILYAIPKTSGIGAILLTGYLGGAILTHVRLHEPVFMHIAFGVIVWLGLYLREPRLHSVLPLRK